jgi:DNA-binding NtrC family response regulator
VTSRILIVSDRHDSPSPTEGILIDAGHQVYLAEPGTDPLLAAFTLRPHLLLAQVACLAGRSLRCADLLGRSRSLPVIVESELAPFELEAALAGRRPPRAILFPPIRKRELLETIREALVMSDLYPVESP